MISDDLIRDRFARVRAAAQASDLDVLVLGRADDVRYVTGVSQLWTAGTRPFGAVATVIVDPSEIFVLSTWEEGMSELVSFDHLHGISWNPSTIASRLAAIAGLASASRVGVDGLSPGFAKLLAAVAPAADIVPADHCLHAARRMKLPAEVEAIGRACEVARSSMQAAVDAMGSGAVELDLAAVAMAAASRHGRVQPAAPPTVHATSTTTMECPVGARRRAIDGGALVRVDLAVLVDGYEGGLGRTVPVDLAGPTVSGLRDELDDAHQRLVDRCIPGASGADLATDAPPHWLVRGLGVGYEPPVIDRRTGHPSLLEAGMVLSVESALFLESFGTMSRRDVVWVGDRGPQVLTTEG